MRRRVPQEQTVFGEVKDLTTGKKEDMERDHESGLVAVTMQPLVVHLVGGEVLLQRGGNVVEVEGASVQVLPVHQILFRETGLLERWRTRPRRESERSYRWSVGRARDSSGCSFQ